MRKDLRRRHEAQSRANRVCRDYSALFDATGGGQKLRTGLGTNVANVAGLFALQARSIQDMRASTEALRRLRVALRDALRVVVKVSKFVKLDDKAMAPLRMPGPMSDADLLAFAGGLLLHVTPYADAFVEEGLPPDLLTTIGRLILAIQGAKSHQSSSRLRFTAATQSIRRTLNTADEAVEALEALARTIPAARPEALTQLRIAKRVGRRATAPAAAAAPAILPIDESARDLVAIEAVSDAGVRAEVPAVAPERYPRRAVAVAFIAVARSRFAKAGANWRIWRAMAVFKPA